MMTLAIIGIICSVAHDGLDSWGKTVESATHSHRLISSSELLEISMETEVETIKDGFAWAKNSLRIRLRTGESLVIDTAEGRILSYTAGTNERQVPYYMEEDSFREKKAASLVALQSARAYKVSSYTTPQVGCSTFRYIYKCYERDVVIGESVVLLDYSGRITSFSFSEYHLPKEVTRRITEEEAQEIAHSFFLDKYGLELATATLSQEKRMLVPYRAKGIVPSVPPDIPLLGWTIRAHWPDKVVGSCDIAIESGEIVGGQVSRPF